MSVDYSAVTIYGFEIAEFKDWVDVDDIENLEEEYYGCPICFTCDNEYVDWVSRTWYFGIKVPSGFTLEELTEYIEKYKEDLYNAIDREYHKFEVWSPTPRFYSIVRVH
jgi:hypothetical protein